MSRPPLQPQNKHVSSYLFKDSTSDAVNLDSPGKYDISDEEESTSASKSRFKNALNTGKDFFARTGKTAGLYNDALCTTCNEIDFHECLPDPPNDNNGPSTSSDSKQRAKTFYRSLAKILDNSKFCNLCRLLKQSICQEEYDLLKAEHIRKYLPEGFGKNKSMSDWVEGQNDWRREWFGDSDLWPFGHALDKSEPSKHTIKDAKKLFSEAEAHDTELNNVSQMYGSAGDSATQVIEAAQFTLGLVPPSTIEDKTARDLVAIGQTVVNQLALAQSKRRKRLPCIFMFRIYYRDEKKAGALSVRVYAHGGAPLAPLQEITHFNLRFESTEKPRCSENQLWYGNKLGPLIDIPFFKHCRKECEESHSGEDGCARPLGTPRDPHPEIEFRLINVKTMSVMVVPFAEVMRENSRYQYAALSYVWGELELLPGWVPVSDSGVTKSWKQKMPDGSWSNPIFDCPDRFKLRKGLPAKTLYRKDSLVKKADSIPKTILDAIKVTRKMDLGYIWIDQLCIMQSGDDADRDGNLERMDLIYRNAVFTIVAADGHDADHGLKGVRCDRGQPKQISEQVIPGANMSLPISIKMNVLPWERRAWTFQEKILSRRLLVFTGGFAIWYCRRSILREDVNALDGDIHAIRFPWPRLAASMPSGDKLKDVGLSLQKDGSLRLLRRPEMSDYIAAVEDFSSRVIGDGWDTLSAFRGISKVLESSNLLGGPFRQGLPVQNMDVALLWQTNQPARRRQNGSKNGETLYAPPSWSPFGWEEISKVEGDGALHALIEYAKPYEVWSAELGMLQRRDPQGLDEEARKRAQSLGRLSTEERIRPIQHTFWILDHSSKLLKPIDAYERLMAMNKSIPPDWEPLKSESENQIRLKFKPPIKPISDRSLMIFAETAMLVLDQQTWRITRTIHVKNNDLSRRTFEDSDAKAKTPEETIETRQEYWLHANQEAGGENPDKPQADSKFDVKDIRIGVGRIDMAGFGAVRKNVKAVVLSEAQYFGNEEIPDVLGYPLYNVLLVHHTENQVYERVGLGQVYKRNWKSIPKQEKVKEFLILE